MDACCATNGVPHDTDHLHLEDPTLADCCRRDLKEQAYNSRVLKQLRQCDISDVRQRVSAGVLKQQIPDSPDSASDIDSLVTDSDDEGLQHARQSRLHELQQQARQRTADWEQNLGHLVEASAAALQDMLADGADLGYLICHIAAEGSQAGNELDELLQSLASQYRGTMFCRTPLTAKEPLHNGLGIESYPGVCIFEAGCLLSQVPLRHLQEDQELIEERAVRYLKQHGALRHRKGDLPADDADDSTGAERRDEGEWQEACKVCGRQYYHEHVRAIRRGNEHHIDLE